MLNVKLLNLKVNGLYGHYNYDVKFNTDVTFIYGENGCGKTTILNITEAIITGALYKLFQYKFSRIVLDFAPSDNLEARQSIVIRTKIKNIAIVFNGEEYTLKRDMYDKWDYADGRSGRIDSYYFSNYSFLNEIKDTFNYVYLPLSRSQNRIYDNDDLYEQRRYIRNLRAHTLYSYDEEEDDIQNVYPSSMDQAIALIRKNQHRITLQLRKIDQAYRNKILKASLESNISVEQKDVLSIIGESENKDQLEHIKSSYIAMMQEVVSASATEVQKYERVFDEFIDKYLAYKSGDKSNGISVQLLLEYQNIKKTASLVKILEEAEEHKRELQKPFELFLSIMNDFIGNGEEKKQLCVDAEGEIYLTTKDRRDEKIGLRHMSSGEKQLLTFFAHLIFGVKIGKPGIFVVDEPELSLHLSWQKMFVEKALAVNANLQLIFATHAPEIIGRYHNKMYKLTKMHIDEKK